MAFAAEFSDCARFHPKGLGLGRRKLRCCGDKAVLSSALLVVFPDTGSCAPPAPLSSSQALILLASPQARRGVRVGSICLCDGHRCQTPRGLEGEERGLVWSRVTDVSELSSGTANRAERAEAGRREQSGIRVRG